MRIYSMTATFGKLEHETLTLQPGLNIIEAPNEWGKSTWCAFLVTMLYGMDTRAKTTKAALADKERFAPWSGSPMSGRIDLWWNGRDITIERTSKGRTPMGVFRAYETASGVEIPELTAVNCGQILLGVERSVFTRAGFLRFSDLPVTQDDTLRHRLNALVTTGDESGAAEALGQKLKDLKNRCRYNKSGLLPQAEDQWAQLERKLRDFNDLQTQAQRLRQRQQEVAQWITQLDNHKNALAFTAAQDDAQRVAAAEAAQKSAQAQYQQLASHCASLPDQEQAYAAIQTLNALHREQESIQLDEQMLPEAPEIPQIPPCFSGVRPEDAVAQAQQDRASMMALKEPKALPIPLLLALGFVAAAAGVILLIAKLLTFAIPTLLAGVAVLAVGLIGNHRHKQQCAAIQSRRDTFIQRYGSDDPAQWVVSAHRYAEGWDTYRRDMEQYRRHRGNLDTRREALRLRTEGLKNGRDLNEWQEILSAWDSLGDARRSLQQAENHLATLQAMAKTAIAPSLPDELTFTDAQTDRLLSDAHAEQRQLHQKLGQCLGQMDTLGSATALQKELDEVQQRIQKLEQTYAALEYALNALAAARSELQRRFAPRITQRAQELFGKLTDGRYDRLTLGEDLTVQAGATDEDILRSHQWRSDGTIDQLYLALRLAVAQELTPDAPLVLDDALVRFDDRRLTTALELLKQEAAHKQVILFTCQNRENLLLNI